MLSNSSSGSYDPQGGGIGFQSPSTGGLNTFNSQVNVRNSNAFSLVNSPRHSPTMPLQTPNRDHNRHDLPHIRNRNDRSLSPNGRGGSRWPDRSQDGSRENFGHTPNQDNQGLKDGYGRPDDETDEESQPFAEALSEPNLIVFNTLANHCGLDDKHRHLALSHSEVIGKNYRHIAGATFHSMLLMEISRLNSKIDTLANQIATGTSFASAPAPVPGPAVQEGQDVVMSSAATDSKHKKWEASRKLVGLMNPMALKFLWSPELEAYTAISNEPEGYLPNSLFNMIKKTLAKETVAFRAQHLPPQRQGVENASDTQSYATALREAGKQGREKLHNVLLVGIHDPKSKEIVGIAVPCIKSMIQRVAIRCGVADSSAEVEAVWQATDQPTRARVAYMRREAARVIVKGHKGNESVWANIDKQLSILRLKRDENYAAAFYDLVFEEDKVYFTGKTWFKDIKADQLAQNKALDLPSEEAIIARMALEAARRVSVPGNSNGGNQGTTNT